MKTNVKAKVTGTITPARVYRAAEDCWYRVDRGLFGRIYATVTGRPRLVRENK